MTGQKLASTITAVILLVAIFVGVVVYGVFSDWFGTSFQRFYLSSGGTKFLQEKKVLLNNAKFDVKFVFAKKQDYHVKIFAAGEDFGYTVNGVGHRFLDLPELTHLFGIEQGKKSFVLRGNGMTVEKALKLLYPGSEVVILAGDEVNETSFFKLVVTAGELIAPTVMFRCSVGVESIELDTSHIYA